jgi:(p)ppGpp synthase/HD superfamily hydrolase
MNLNVIKAPKLTHRFEQALVYAHRLHHKQTRKGGNVPYISHLLSVAALVLEDGGDENEAIAALLHDAVEDQCGKKTGIKSRCQPV